MQVRARQSHESLDKRRATSYIREVAGTAGCARHCNPWGQYPNSWELSLPGSWSGNMAPTC